MFDGVGKDFALQVGIYKSQVGLKFKLVRIRSETIGDLQTSDDAGESIGVIHSEEDCFLPFFIHLHNVYL